MNQTQQKEQSFWQIFLVFLRLGLTSFGGPVAHLGYFRDEFVARRGWLSEKSYGDLIALCQFLPGPASSQVGLAIGFGRGGYPGAFAAWLGFTMPSALLLILFALGITGSLVVLNDGAIQGLKIVALAVVANAVWGMGRNFCTDLSRAVLMVSAALCMLLVSTTLSQIAVLIFAGATGVWLLKPNQKVSQEQMAVPTNRRSAVLFLLLFAILLAGLPLLARIDSIAAFTIFDAFYRTGSLVFGGGHVVLPLLQAEVVPPGWIDNEVFLAGYGAAQAVPGPLFTFAAFLGGAMEFGPSGWSGAIIALLAIFLPSFLLVFGCLPLWESLRHNGRIQAALSGVNAAVVGLLLAALYQPVWTSTIQGPLDIGFALLALSTLVVWKLPPWVIVLASAAIGGLLGLI